MTPSSERSWARFPALLAVASLLSVGAWLLASGWREPPRPTGLVLQRSLMGDLRFAELVRTTERVNLGATIGQRFTVEAQPSDGEAAVGVLSRPDARPPYAWLVGARPVFFLDVVQPTDRTLALNLASATDAVQKVSVSLNGHALGSARLRRDGKPMTVRVPAPAGSQVLGRNRVQLEFTRVQEQVLDGEQAALPVAASIRSVRFLPPEQEAALKPGEGARGQPAPRARLVTAAEDERLQSELVLPGGTGFGLGCELPPAERVALRMQLVRLDLPLELWASPDGAPPRLLARVEPGVSAPGTLSVDLSPWAGVYLRLDGTVAAGSGSVALRGLSLVVPEESPWARPGESPEAERPFAGQLEVLREGEAPLLSWTEGELCLEVDLDSRRRGLFDLRADPARTTDLFLERPAAASWLFQELCRAVQARESLADWSRALRWSSIRQ